jgi:hypothetical protein
LHVHISLNAHIDGGSVHQGAGPGSAPQGFLEIGRPLDIGQDRVWMVRDSGCIVLRLRRRRLEVM